MYAGPSSRLVAARQKRVEANVAPVAMRQASAGSEHRRRHSVAGASEPGRRTCPDKTWVTHPCWRRHRRAGDGNMQKQGVSVVPFMSRARYVCGSQARQSGGLGGTRRSAAARRSTRGRPHRIRRSPREAAATNQLEAPEGLDGLPGLPAPLRICVLSRYAASLRAVLATDLGHGHGWPRSCHGTLAAHHQPGSRPAERCGASEALAKHLPAKPSHWRTAVACKAVRAS